MSKLGSMIDKAIHRFPKSDARLPIPGAKIGIEVELEGWNGRNDTTHWVAKEDHSLRNHGIEFVTNGPVIGEDIIPAVEEICAFALKQKYSDGNPRAGIHIHVDCTDLEVETNDLARVVSNYMLVEHALFGFAGQDREHCGYCIPYYLSNQDFKLLGKVLYEQTNKKVVQNALSNMSKYQALNLRPLVDLGTVEFRHLPTTFDSKKILNWIDIILALKRSASDRNSPSALAAFSKHGPAGYAERIMGEQFHLIRPWIDPNAMWNAVDNATAIMAAGNVLKPVGSWSSQGGSNPLLKMKADLMAKAGKKKEKSVRPTLRPDVQMPGLRIEMPALGQRIVGDVWTDVVSGQTYSWSPNETWTLHGRLTAASVNNLIHTNQMLYLRNLEAEEAQF